MRILRLSRPGGPHCRRLCRGARRGPVPGGRDPPGDRRESRRHGARALRRRCRAPASRGPADRLHLDGEWLPLGEDIILLRFPPARPAHGRAVHGRTNQLADSATAMRAGRLSPLGPAMGGEMNRLGIIIDASHSSDATSIRYVQLETRSRIVLSHSGPKAIFRPSAQPRRRRIAPAWPRRAASCS